MPGRILKKNVQSFKGQDTIGSTLGQWSAPRRTGRVELKMIFINAVEDIFADRISILINKLIDQHIKKLP